MQLVSFVFSCILFPFYPSNCTFYRITDPSHPFYDCFTDSHGEPLRFAPDNHPTPPGGDGTQLMYRALPHYEATVQQRAQNLKPAQLTNLQKSPNLQALLKGKHQPIPINNEHELAHLYLQEYYKKQTGCNILNLDASAILNILSKAEVFPDNIKKQAAKVRDEVRNKWAHAIISEWTAIKLNAAFSELKKLAQMMPNSAALLGELDEDLTGAKEFEFPMKDFLLKVHKFRTIVKNGNHKKFRKGSVSSKAQITRKYTLSEGLKSHQLVKKHQK